MAKKTDPESAERERRGRRPASGPVTDGNPGLMRTLWADLRKQPVPSQPDPMEDVWFEEEQQISREMGSKAGTVRQLSPERREKWRRWYWNT